MDLNIQGKTALITGADSGIGLATAKILLEEGVQLVLSDLKKDTLDEAIQEIKDSNNKNLKIAGIAADITKNDEVVALAKKVKIRFWWCTYRSTCCRCKGCRRRFSEINR